MKIATNTKVGAKASKGRMQAKSQTANERRGVLCFKIRAEHSNIQAKQESTKAILSHWEIEKDGQVFKAVKFIHSKI